jgi:hypothetical protein
MGTQDTGRINIRENWRNNQEWPTQCLWIVHSWLSLQFFLMFIRPVSCVPISPMSLDCSFFIVPSVFPNVYSSCVWKGQPRMNNPETLVTLITRLRC